MSQYLYRLVVRFPTALADGVHTCVGFVTAGLSVAHPHLNWSLVKSCVRLLNQLI